MVPAPMTRLSGYQSQAAIDLTRDDKEVTGESSIPHSNDGLILPGTFPLASTENSQSHMNPHYSNRAAPTLPANLQSKGSAMSPYNGFKSAPILPGATVANRKPKSKEATRTSNAKRRDQTGSKDSRLPYLESHSVVENAPKRRRISGAMGEDNHNQEMQETVGNRHPKRRVMRRMAGQAQENGDSTDERSHQDLRPTIELPIERRRSTRGTAERKSIQYLNGEEQGDEEFTSSRRSSALVIIPLSGATSKSSRLVRSPVSQTAPQVYAEFSQILNDQVFVHIKAAMARHNRTINPQKLHEIGTSVAGVLVNNPMFEDLNRYGGTLSREDEIEISEKARNYVDNFVAQSLALPALEHTQKGYEPKYNVKGNGDDASRSNRVSSVLKDSPVSTDYLRPRSHSSSPAISLGTDMFETAGFYERRKTKKASNFLPPPTRCRRSRAHFIRKEPIVSSEFQFPEDEALPKINSEKYASSQYVSSDTMQIDINLAKIDMKSSHDKSAVSQPIDGQPRPYIDARSRDRIRRGLERASDQERKLLLGRVYHVDFCKEELSIVRRVLQSQVQVKGKESLSVLMQKQKLKMFELVSLLMSQGQTLHADLGRDLLHSRGSDSLSAFLRDATTGEVSTNARTLEVGPKRSSSQLSILLRQREMHGTAPVRSCVGKRSYLYEINTLLEDSLQRKVEWTDCCGDIWAISWTSSDSFLCGATAHSDSHNMQYNKPGNLVVGSVSKETLDAIPNHRIIRPIVKPSENAENALDSMRQTQDPWLYTSISAISHSEKSGLSFTASFDKTVKVWMVSSSDNGSSMDVLGTWPHEGKVNFVTTSECHDLVATASDVHKDAVRVYRIKESNVDGSEFDTYNSERAAEQAQELQREDLWAYYPATIQWGKAENVSHLLLVGYSPRAISNDEIDIPEDKRNSGELCLWDTSNGSRVPIASARNQNVFEVIWHPTKPAFIAATSPCGVFKSETKTQIRLFVARTDNYGCTDFYPIRVLDCPALDINELTIMPNSFHHCYVTASCTDGNTYVWDTGAVGDDAIHVLPHGESLDNPYHDIPRELADTGVKFAAWGKTSERFYTGASDGRVKSWDIHRPRGKAFVREVLVASGGIGAGAFSSDFSKLIIGDATGKVHLLTRSEDDPELENSDDEEYGDLLQVESKKKNCVRPHIRGPRLIKHHPEPAPPEGYAIQDFDTGLEISNQFVQQNFIAINPDPAIGAVQGPKYHELGMYRFDAHVDQDGTKPLLPYYQARQQHDLQTKMVTDPIPVLPVLTQSSDLIAHMRNLSLNFEFSKLEPATQNQLLLERVQLEADDDFVYEMCPKIDIFRNKRSEKHQSDRKKGPNQ